ncbi:MAG: hypothetical protein M1837_006180 [Sclerophora amabilis]|nr:MAG: hypothetical protein M1837_006180 [Sclerophora amabilis]
MIPESKIDPALLLPELNQRKTVPALTVGLEIQFGLSVGADTLHEYAHRYWNEVHPRCPDCDGREKDQDTIQQERERFSRYRNVTDTFRLVAHLLREAGLDAVFHREGLDGPKDFRRWNVTHPAAGPMDPDHSTSSFLVPPKLIELDSPPLLFDGEGGQWMDPVRTALDAIGGRRDRRIIQPQLRHDCALHVHVGVARGTPFPFKAVQTLVAIWGVYESSVLRLQPFDDGVAGRPHEHLRKERTLLHTTEKDACEQSRRQYTQGLYDCAELGDLISLIGCRKEDRLNLLNQTGAGILHNKGQKVTVEFRDHQSTVAPADVYWWIMLVAKVVQVAYLIGEVEELEFNGIEGPVSLVDLLTLIDFPAEGTGHMRRRYHEYSVVAQSKEGEHEAEERCLEPDPWG